MDRGQRLDVVSIDRANRGRPSRGRRCDRSLSDAERPPAPAVEPDPELEPVDPGSTTLAAEPSTQPPNNDPAANVDPEPPPEPEVPPDIPGEQIPYNPAFSSSPAIPDEAFNAFLIIGTDKGGRRADVIILALLPEDGSAPILVSLPRDLWLQIPCWEKPNRINAALNGCGSAASGPELLALTVAEFTESNPIISLCSASTTSRVSSTPSAVSRSAWSIRCATGEDSICRRDAPRPTVTQPWVGSGPARQRSSAMGSGVSCKA